MTPQMSTEGDSRRHGADREQEAPARGRLVPGDEEEEARRQADDEQTGGDHEHAPAHQRHEEQHEKSRAGFDPRSLQILSRHQRPHRQEEQSDWSAG
jgi:hypothetical protein